MMIAGNVAREVYRVTLHRGGNVASAADRLARYIINRWLPGNAGGVHLLLTPQLTVQLSALWLQVYESNRDRILVVDTRDNQPRLFLE